MPEPAPGRAGELEANDDRFGFNYFAHLAEHDKILSAGVDYLVLHKDLRLEVPGLTQFIDMSDWIALYRQRQGAPAYEDELVTVFRIR